MFECTSCGEYVGAQQCEACQDADQLANAELAKAKILLPYGMKIGGITYHLPATVITTNAEGEPLVRLATADEIEAVHNLFKRE